MTLHLLGWIKSLLTAHFSRWHALTVNYPNAWFGLAPGLSSYIAAAECVDVLPCSIIAPSAIVIPDVIPSRKIARQHSPLTTGSGTIECSIQDFTDIAMSNVLACYGEIPNE